MILQSALFGVTWLASCLNGQCFEPWTDERRAGPFVCHADFPLDDYQPFLDSLGMLQRDLKRTLGVGPAGEWIHLFLFRKEATYHAYLAAYFPGTPTRRALYIKQRGPGMVFAYRHAQLDVDLRHECTHALLHAALPVVPLWLDEGLAEYFEMPRDDRLKGHSHATRLGEALRLRQMMKIEELEAIGDLSKMGQTEYRWAWAWVHFLLHGPPEGYDELVRFLADLRAHVPSAPLSERLRRRLPDLEDQFVDHFRRWSR